MKTQRTQNDLDTNLLLKLYHELRYVHPVEKTHFDFAEDDFIESSSECYAIWGNNQVCNNCISMRALKENKVAMKFEYLNQRVYLITAMPETKNNRVLELIRDVTDEYIIEKLETMSEVMIIQKLESLNKEVITDNLTKLYNRKFLEERLPYDLTRAFSNQLPISIVMVDIDHFKAINDTYGHTMGDQVLVELAAIIRSSIRSEDDWAVRYGGEEFLLYVYNIDSKLLYEKMETLRKLVENNLFCKGTSDIHLTISCGLQNQYIAEESDIQDMYKYIKKADDALYEAKKNGRNRCVIK